MKYITLSWEEFLKDPAFWQKISNEKSIPLHIGSSGPSLKELLQED